MTGKISELVLIRSITGNEFIEVVTTDETGKLVNRRMTLDTLMGAQGKSAYDLALANGFVGSLSDWLSSLDGNSAYEIAVIGGFTGTQEEWLQSLVGAEGKSAFDLAVANGFTGTQAEYLKSLEGKSAFQLAKDAGFEGTEAEYLASLKGVDGKSAYELAVDNGFVGTEAEFIAAINGKTSVGGAVFITEITPVAATENVGEKVLAADEVSILQCSSTTRDLKVKVLALTGHSKYRPTVTVNGQLLTLTAKADAPLFEGTITISLDDTGVITALHEDGAKWVTSVKMDTPPQVLTGVFTGGYPLGQTELKANDTYSIQFTTDVDVVGYELADFGAFQAATGTVASGKSFTINGLKIADRGNSTTSQGFRLRVKKANGALSDWFQSNIAGTTDGTHNVKLNNLYPTITLGTIQYPNGQGALKGSEVATVNHTVSNATSVEYQATDLSVANPQVYEATKLVTRVSGDYNVATSNLTINALRSANGAISSKGVVVAIANTLAQVTLSVPAKRLRSGGNNGTVAQEHVITLTSTQALSEAPTLNAPAGTWVGEFTANASKTVWTRKLRVHDNDAKGTFSFNSLSAKSLSGQSVTQITSGDSYVLGGFVFRTLTVPAYPNREADIGTQVEDVTKLKVTNLSKGASGSLNFAYKADLSDALNSYTITGPSKTLNAEGNLWYNLDPANATSNTGGAMKIEIEESI